MISSRVSQRNPETFDLHSLLLPISLFKMNKAGKKTRGKLSKEADNLKKWSIIWLKLLGPAYLAHTTQSFGLFDCLFKTVCQCWHSWRNWIVFHPADQRFSLLSAIDSEPRWGEVNNCLSNPHCAPCWLSSGTYVQSSSLLTLVRLILFTVSSS